ncbi:MAG: hypothetical protein OEM67_10820 [Thermoleophilia bacterium]|nr:hypothetical protein [Thermoleophilia bacterium]
MADPVDHEQIDKLLDEIQLKHFEMAGMVGEYRTMVLKLKNERDEEALKLARSLPGARYHVAAKYAEEQWKVVQAQLARLFGSD